MKKSPTEKAELGIQLRKGVHDHSEGKLPTVSAILAAAAEENLQHLLALADQPDEFRKMLEIRLGVVRKNKRKMRRMRRDLTVVEPDANGIPEETGLIVSSNEMAEMAA